MTRTTSPGLARVQAERTSPVLAHVQAEREMQDERWGWMNDALHSDDDWNGLITSRLTRPGASRYVRLVQAAAIVVAAAEHEFAGRKRPWRDEA